MNNSVKIAHFEPKQSSFLQKLATTARFARLRGLLRLHASITLFKIRFLLSENFLTKFKVNQMWRKVNSKKIKANPMCFSQCTPYMVKLTQRGAFDKIQSYPNVLHSAKRNDSEKICRGGAAMLSAELKLTPDKRRPHAALRYKAKSIFGLSIN